MTVILVPVLVVSVALIAIAVRRRRVVVPRPVLVETVRRMARPKAAPEAAAAPRVANGTPPAQVIPLALRDDESLVATPAVVIGLARIRRGNAARAQSSGEIEAEAHEDQYDDTLPPTIIVDES